MICFFNRGVISYRETGPQIYDCYSDVARKLWNKECQRSPEAGVKVVDIVIVVPKTDVTRCEIVLCEGRRGHQLVKDLKLNNQDNRQVMIIICVKGLSRLYTANQVVVLVV